MVEEVKEICKSILENIKPIDFDSNDNKYIPYVRQLTSPEMSSRFLKNEVAMKNACCYGIAAHNARTVEELKEYTEQEMAWYAVAVLHDQLDAYVPLGQVFEENNNKQDSEKIWKAAAELGSNEAQCFLGLIDDYC
jgi:hypothetical protein